MEGPIAKEGGGNLSNHTVSSQGRGNTVQREVPKRNCIVLNWMEVLGSHTP